VTDACIGLAYEARFKSAKQAFGAALGTPLNQRKRIDHVGMILMNTHKGGIQFGPDFETMDDMPAFEREQEVGAGHIWQDYDGDMISFPGEWSTDSRLCLKAAAPRPCTVLAVTTSMLTNDKT